MGMKLLLEKTSLLQHSQHSHLLLSPFPSMEARLGSRHPISSFPTPALSFPSPSSPPSPWDDALPHPEAPIHPGAVWLIPGSQKGLEGIDVGMDNRRKREGREGNKYSHCSWHPKEKVTGVQWSWSTQGLE